MTRQVTMYICDGKKCGKKAMYCKPKHKNNWLCQHTTSAKNAKNGSCSDPWNHPERFDEVREHETMYFIEKEETK